MKNGYIKRQECHASMDSINKRIEDFHNAINIRIDDLGSKVDMAVELLKDGKR